MRLTPQKREVRYSLKEVHYNTKSQNDNVAFPNTALCQNETPTLSSTQHHYLHKKKAIAASTPQNNHNRQ